MCFVIPKLSFLIRRFKTADIPGAVSKGAPDFCNVYSVAKGKIHSMRPSTRPAPAMSPLKSQLQSNNKTEHSDPGPGFGLPPTNNAMRG